ncbi:MAG TPA: MltA domain-containing protein, partial [Telluria sp.]|nr:MltA domain-containing protein [Telluria sp.]
MLKTRRSVSAFAIAVASMLAACTTTPPPQPPEQPKPPVVMPPPVGPVAVPVQPPPPAPLMTPEAFAELPGWQEDDLRQAWPAFMGSCRAMATRSGWKDACAAARGVDAGDPAAIRTYFESWFVPNKVRAADGSDTGLITGYYEAMLYGSRKRAGDYQTPLYKVPDDLLTIDLSGVYPNLKSLPLRG